ncbi:MAG: Holliday junction branch migration DNA helicase RuvB [Sandaracinaceae bacterium]|nr:Holliday junction branch migration DNA helicase RuvB [Sandaracinaceae bacterium]
MLEPPPQKLPSSLDPLPLEEEQRVEAPLRPLRLSEFIGQRRLTENLRVYIEAARSRNNALDHVLISGPPGLGKTTLAFILAEELGVQLHLAHAPAIEHRGQLAALLTRLGPRDVLFIDEIHRLSSVVEENLYTAMEDYRIDLVQGEGPMANVIRIPLSPFTLVGATTRTGLLTGPLLSRFGIELRLDYYDPQDLCQIVLRSASILGVAIDEKAAFEIARRSRGTPRIANRLLRRVRDFAQVLGNGRLDLPTTRQALERLDIDEAGLDEMSRRFLRVLIESYEGGPVGIDALAATLGEPRDTLEDVFEPYLLQSGFIARTSKGRIATRKAYEHLRISPPKKSQGSLF